MMWSTVGQKSLYTLSSVTGICKLAQLSRVPSLKTIRLDRPFIDKKLTYSRQLSFTAEVCRRRNPVQYDETLFEREYDKSKHQMDLDLDDPTEALRKVAGDNERKERAIKKARAARLFPQPQEERTLTRDTIEQIRFLKQENQDDEWTIPKLAESFDVSKEVVIKILKSKFTPSETRRQKQDLKAYMNTGLLPPGTDIQQQAIADGDAPPNPDYLLEDGHRSKPMLADGKPRSLENISAPRINYRMSKGNTPMGRHGKNTKHSKSDSEERYGSAAAGYTSKVQMTSGVAETDGGQSQEGSRGAAATNRIPKKAVKNRRKGFHGKNDQQLARGIQKSKDANEFGNFVESDEDYAHEEGGGGSDEHVKLIQKGREFYDENGEFLYRI